jgi:hypothetical protein
MGWKTVNFVLVILLFFLISCAPQKESGQGISDEELFGTDQGVSDEELFWADSTVTGGAILGNLDEDGPSVCRIAVVGSCAEDSQGVIHIIKGDKADTRGISRTGDGSVEYHYSCPNPTTIQRCDVVQK